MIAMLTASKSYTLEQVSLHVGNNFVKVIPTTFSSLYKRGTDIENRE